MSPIKVTPMRSKLGRIMIALPLAWMLTACASNPPTYQPPSLPPIVNCGENLPSEPLPDYPQLHQRVAGETDQQYIADLERDRTAAAKWAVIAAGIAERNAIRRNTTAACISAIRAQHVFQ